VNQKEPYKNQHYSTIQNFHVLAPRLRLLVTLSQKGFIKTTKYGENGQRHKGPKYRMASMRKKQKSY